MTYKEKYQKTRDWRDKIFIIELYHLQQKISHEKWIMQNTADYFEISRALVTENLTLATALKANLGLEECNTRDEAVKKLKKMNNG